MKKVLIIGVGGFVGPYLVHEFSINNYEVYGTKIESENINVDNCKIYNLNICNKDEITSLLKQINPDYIVHLAAQSSVALSWKKPQMTFEINVIGTINLLESIKEICPKSRILLVGSSEEYGKVESGRPVNEQHTCNPTNIYALSKYTQEQIGRLYFDAYGINVMFTRSFNHIGPGQSSTFVVSDFCNQVVNIENGIQEYISVGNLDAYRDFTDVRDVVNAYRVIIEKGNIGESYNVGSGKAIKIKEILNSIIELSNVKINIVVDKSRFRPIDVEKIECDNSKLVKLGWNISYTIDNSLKDIIGYFRKHFYEIGREKLLNFTFNNYTMDEAISKIDLFIKNKYKGYVVTPNTDHAVILDKSTEFQKIYDDASFVFIDGKPLIWIARKHGIKVKEKLSGSDLFPKVCELCSIKGYSMFFLGAKDGIAKLAADKLKKKYNGLIIKNTFSPKYGFESDKKYDENILSMINGENINVLILGLGSPKQEKWAYKHINELNVNLILCIGASLDFEAGNIKRAPKFMQNIGLEWFYRFIKEPRRLFKRYFIDDIKILSIMRKYKK